MPTGYEEVEETEDYSTSETNTGKKWIDGKPIYRKVLVFPNGTGQTTQKDYTLTDYGINNVSNIYISTPSYYTYSGTTRKYPFPYYDGNAFSCNVTTTQLTVTLGYSDIANSEFVITLEYTKTTDGGNS